MNPLFALGVNNEPIVRPRANNTHCPGVRGPRTTQIAPDSVYSILFAQLYKNGRLLQPGPRDNGNYPPEGCIVLPEGRRRPKVEAAQRQDNAVRRRIISGWPEGKVVIITFLYSRANNMVPDPGTISPKPGIMGLQTPGQ